MKVRLPPPHHPSLYCAAGKHS